MKQITPGAVILMDGCKYVFVCTMKGQAIIVPVNRRRSKGTRPHRSDLILETEPALIVPCYRAKAISPNKLPKPRKSHGTITPQHVAAIKAAIKLEFATQAAENAYQPVRDHTARGFNNIYHERQ